MVETTYDAPGHVTPERTVLTANVLPGTATLPFFLATLAVAVFIGVLTGSMINVLLPLIRADFAASPAQAGWIITGFALAYAVGIPLYGKLARAFGLRRLFALGLLAFALGGLICALAPSLVVLVLGRVVQGIGGSAVAALAPVAIAQVLLPGARGGALGLIASSVGIGQVVGPIAGGMLGQVADWRLLFVGTLVLALLIVPAVLWVLPANDPGGSQRIDLVGAVLLSLAAALTLFAVTQGQAEGFAAVSSWGSLLAGGLAGAGFAYRITHAADPFISPRLFRNRVYLSAALVAFFTMFAYLSTIILAPWLVIEVNGLSPATAGLVLTPGALAIALLSPLSGRLSDRIGAQPLIVVGLAVMGIANLALSLVAGASPLLVALGMSALGVGFGLLTSPLTNAAANALTAEETGEGLGLYQGLFFLGGGIGAAVTAALLAARRDAETAVNPWASLDAVPFSDAYLASVLAVIIALFAARSLRTEVPMSQSTPADASDATDVRSQEQSWNAEVIAEFRASGGQVAAPYDDPPPMLLLHTIGARSGREHIVPMRSLEEGDTLYVFGSAHGSARHPDWYYNVVANPDFVIEKGTETIPVHATELHGAERETIFARHAARFPIFTEYEARTGRTIPVIRLDRRNNA